MGIATLTEAIDGLFGDGPNCYASGSDIIELERQFSRLEAFRAATTAAFDAQGDWASDGATSAPAWIATRCHLPGGVARKQLRRGRALRHLDLVAQAFGAGDFSGAHVDTVLAVRRRETEATLERDQALLIDQARHLRFDQFERVMAYWEQRADPDEGDDAEAARRNRRDVTLAQSFGGLWLGTITLDPVAGAIVKHELDRLQSDLFDEDWGKAKAELGRDPHPHELARSGAQRRADALVEMATRSASRPKGAQRPKPLFSVLVGYETLYGHICQLEGAGVLVPAALTPHLDAAWFERAIFGPGTRVEVSVTARLFSGGTRRAIQLRDQFCTHPYCDMPAARCQVDHIIEFNQGGPTDQENGRLLCRFHNNLRNQRPPPGD